MGLFNLARPALFSLPPEVAHELSIQALRYSVLPIAPVKPDQRLEMTVGGLTFPNPVGLAAGYDKNAEVPDAILRLGFGFTEVGTVTPLPQPGNPKPRVFRLTRERGLINRLGFNNHGHEKALERLEARGQRKGIVGVNIGANKNSEDFVADYEAGIETFVNVASYFTANISSPNTPGLRNLQAAEALEVLLERIFSKLDECTAGKSDQKPVFLKIAPDLEPSQIDEIADVVKASRLSALIVSNTTLDRDMLTHRTHADEAGGLSGKPVFEKSTRVLAQMYHRIGDRVPLIGVGGISSADDAIAKVEAGASLVQLYSGMVYAGPLLAATIVKGMSKHLDQLNAAHLKELVGTKVDLWI